MPQAANKSSDFGNQLSSNPCEIQSFMVFIDNPEITITTIPGVKAMIETLLDIDRQIIADGSSITAVCQRQLVEFSQGHKTIAAYITIDNE